ncbi:MAG: sigma-70 family RNA polymerase sigma factor [Myxococcota bacterium]
MHAPQRCLTLQPTLDRTLSDAVRRACARWPGAQAEDITQTTRIRLFRRAQQRPAMTFTPSYVRRAARYAVIDAARRQNRNHELRSRYEATVAVGAVAVTDDPETRLLADEMAQAVAEQVDHLPPARREVVMMYLDGDGVSEIARRLGCPRKRVDNLLYRGLATLRHALAQQGMSPQA